MAGSPLEGVTPWPPEIASLYRERGYWRGTPLGRAVDAAVARHHDRVALVDGERRWTYRDLGRLVAVIRQRQLATRRVGRFLLRRSLFQPLLVTPPHEHGAPYLSFLIRGSQRETGSWGCRHYPSGSLHFHPSGEPHAVNIGERGMTSLSFGPGGRVGLRLDAQPDGAIARGRRTARAQDGLIRLDRRAPSRRIAI